MINLVIRFLVSRLKERSSIKVIITCLAGAFGIQLCPEKADLIVGAVVAFLASIGILTPEKER